MKVPCIGSHHRIYSAVIFRGGRELILLEKGLLDESLLAFWLLAKSLLSERR
jgi:hypothetical protein